MTAENVFNENFETKKEEEVKQEIKQKEYKISLEEIHKEEEQRQLLDLFNEHSDSSVQTIAQGEFKGKWYFGKQIELKSKKVDSIIMEDGTLLINTKMQYPQKKDYEQQIKDSRNFIEEYGFRVGKPLLTPENFWSKDSINLYIRKKNNVGECSLKKKLHSFKPLESIDCADSVVSVVSLSEKEEEGLNPLQVSLTLSYTTTLTTLTTLTALTTQTPKQAILIEKKSLENLLKLIQDYYMDVYDEKITTLTTSYILSTYLYELFDSIGYLFLCSDSGTGKTKWSNIIQYCSFNSINATNTTEAAMFRIVEQSKGTLFIDDYEKIQEDKKNSIDQLLKVGYKRGGKTCRAEKVGDNFVPVFFDVYCPKVITNTEGLDSITYSRCIPLHLIKTLSTKGALNPKSNDLFWQQIRDCCYIWAMENWKLVKKNYNDLDVSGLNNRDLELVKPILAVAKTFSEESYEEVLTTVKDIFANRDLFDFSSDWDYILFSSLQKYYKNNFAVGEWMQTKEILDIMLGNMVFDEDDKKRPSVKWTGRLLSRIDLFEKKREAAGVKYKLNLGNIEKYMKTRGWIKEEEPKP